MQLKYFWAYRHCGSYSLTKPDFFRFRVSFRACSLENVVGDPPLLYISDLTNSSSYSRKRLRKKINVEELSRERP